MAPLALTLALLAMTVATTAIEAVPLDMAQDSFDDQYLDCVPAMAAALPALNRSEFQQNKNFARVWAKATAEWNKKKSTLSYLPSHQAIALMAYTMDDLYEEFNEAVLEAGRSPQEYRDNFHFKTLHFLLTQALGRLRDIQRTPLRCVRRLVPHGRFEAEPGDSIRFGHFVLTSLCQSRVDVSRVDTVFSVETSQGVDIREFSSNPSEKQVLIPPFETFKINGIDKQGNLANILLNSTGTFSNFNCEWLRGGSISRDPPYLRGLLLATVAMAVATGTL